MYYSDKPITKNEEDQLGRGDFAKMLAQSLAYLKVTDTFTIGLFGKWGSGKTSIVNMMLHELESIQHEANDEDRIVVVHFEPWNFASTDQLLSQFFIRLSSEFKCKEDKNLSKIASALDKYSDGFELLKAIPAVGGALSTLGKAGASAASDLLKKGDDPRDIQKQKKYIVDLLSQQSNRVLVVIDDIDRLSSEQIRQVFQLVASVARFPNTIYLLVFDKDIVVDALKKVQEGDGEDYLEKIIQMPIQIPDAPKGKVFKVFYDKINQVIKEYDSVSFSQERWDRLFRYCIGPFIRSLRDVNRLCNSVRFKLTTLYSETDFFDLVSISAIEIALPQVYEWIKRNKPTLTGFIGISSISFFDEPSQKELLECYRTEILNVLKNDEEKTVIAINCLIRLFPYFGQKIGKIYETYDKKQLRRDNNIAHPDKFDRYFMLDLEDGELRKAEINNAIFSLSEEEFEAVLLKLDEEGKSFDLLEEIHAIGEKLPYDRASTIIKALFNMSSKLSSVNTNALIFRASSRADYLILDLLRAVAPQFRARVITENTNNATQNTLPVLATLINRLELGYGRLAGNGNERSEYKIVSLEELIMLEDLFKQQAEKMLESNSIFELQDWIMVDYLLECFDPDFMQKYYEVVLKNDKNILQYFSSSVIEWTGSGTEFEIKDDYKKRLTEEQITQAIEALKISGDLFLLPKSVQNKCAAFVLYQKEKEKQIDHNIPIGEAEGLLQSWQSQEKTEYSLP